MTRFERRAALAVLGATAGVAAAGIRLAKKRAKYLAEKAAATFSSGLSDEYEEEPSDEPEDSSSGDKEKV